MKAQMLKSSWQPDTPLYLQLYQRYRDAIATGRLSPGERVPSIRNLASELHVARGTVEMAYQMLVSEGYLVTKGAAGTRVSPQLATLPKAGNPLPQHRTSGVQPYQVRQTGNILPFQPGVPALDAFPRKIWSRLSGQTLRMIEATMMNYPDPAGYTPLREAIATYLGISRGIACTPEQVFITIGYQGALELLCRTVLRTGDDGWYENPGYFPGRYALQQMGMTLTPVPVDEEGLQVAVGQQMAPNARFAVVTPSHQSPTGVALSLPRRLALLAWANQKDAWIIEDDYDSEFRYHGHPLPALKSLDHEQRVLYTGTFSKVLFPGLRLAYLVVPPALQRTFHEAVNHGPGPGSILPQAMVAAFMQQGHFARHLRKMRQLYAVRRGYLVEALERIIGSSLHIQPQAGGIQVLAWLNEHQCDKTLATAAQAAGLGVRALSEWEAGTRQQNGLLMGFTNFTRAEEAQAAVKRLAALLAP
ncbi:MocR-like pyridoxine biosynthesis transcription factor PdxR [Kosakonia oryzae]|uniref:GntR family transcriptional regulator / MocR family aminotransferase n=1 Tax=Kosakonia oryzae TaxID=497725 RepID=A0AA94KQZ4_9ENTR|nr:PLP-dependent aminotransferase family protein [Kosakonia oryzae]ANI81537.1 PLP-dependent aminotransferase family protein [Kosakonia oryzae]SFC81090.1 GntR family transcriptional regulator / MocR family aminotransferase [Kosakonia oryzae]